MSYDLYVALGGESKQDINSLVNGRYRGANIPSVFERVQLLTGIAAGNPDVKDYAVSGDRRKGGGYKKLVHASNPEDTPYAKELIRPALSEMDRLGLLPTAPDLKTLPSGSWFLQFTFTLEKPWMSKDDDIFYVTESVNPVRKEKVFKVPMMSASSWKGLLRWTAMHTRLALKKDALVASQFATERFVQTLFFGDEAGEEPGGRKNFAAYLDALNPDARPEYERRMRAYYRVKNNDPLPHHSGRLMFYPTFFDLIGVEVINPHSRETKAGTHPIYLESVPAGAKGTFSLLYVPFDRIGKDEGETKQQALADLRLIVEGLRAMFTVYGFGAKTSSGFGVAEERVENGVLVLNLPDIVFPQAAAPQAQKPDDAYLKYLDGDGKVHSAFEGSGEGGLMSNREYKNEGQQLGGGSLSEFKAFRQWYSQHGEQWRETLKGKSQDTTFPTFPFKRLGQINDALNKMGVGDE